MIIRFNMQIIQDQSPLILANDDHVSTIILFIRDKINHPSSNVFQLKSKWEKFN